MIRQLNSMSLQDRNYRHLYYKVMNLDTTEFAAKCVYREPIKLATAPQYAISPTDLPALPPRPVNHYPNHAPITSYPSHALASSYPNLAPQTTYPNNVPLGNSPRSFRPP